MGVSKKADLRMKKCHERSILVGGVEEGSMNCRKERQSPTVPI